MQLRKALTGLLALLAMTPLSGELPSQPWDNHLKSHLTPRAQLAHLSQEYAHWHSMVYKPSCYNWPHYHLAINGFYRETTNEKEAGDLFGAGKKNNGIILGTTGGVYSVPKPAAATAPDKPATLDPAPLIFADRSRMMRDITGPITEKAGMVFKPQQSIGGVRFDFHYDLGIGDWTALFFQASTPLVYVENKVGVSFCDDRKGDDTSCGSLLEQYFSGRYEVKQANNLQAPLTKAKIRKSNHRFGFADFKLSLGYKYYETESSHLFMKVNLIAPSGNKETGEYLFDAVYGNGGHVGLGWQVDGGTSFDCTQHVTIKFMGSFAHTYLFEANEMRTPAILDATTQRPIILGQYYLAGLINQENSPLFPAANVITQKMRIKPGHQLEGLIAGSLQSSNFVIDAGYNMFWKDRENAWIKAWQDKRYYLADVTYDTAKNLNKSALGTEISRKKFDTRSVENPVLFTHTVYGSIGYNLSLCKKNYMLLSVGGSYELSSSSPGFDAYAVWVKTGFAF